MKDKKWAMISALVGFIGGGFSALSPFLLVFAAIAKSQFIQDAFSLLFLVLVFAALLSILSGIRYAVCLKNFEE